MKAGNDRLRGEAAQAEQQAVAQWQVRVIGHAWQNATDEYFADRMVEIYQADGSRAEKRALYEHPQPAAPAPAAGDAVHPTAQGPMPDAGTDADRSDGALPAPANKRALRQSMAELRAYLDAGCDELMTVSQSESAALVLQEMGRLASLESTSVHAAPVAGDASRVDDAMVERGAAGIWGAVPRGVPWPPEREGMADEWRGFSRACLFAALAQDRASQITDDRFPGGLADAIEYANEMEEGAGWAYTILFGIEDDGSKTGTELIDAVITQLRASQAGAAGVPEGWRLVPVEPTPAMISAMTQEHAAYMHGTKMVRVYAAMLAAAPTPAAEGEVRNG